MDKMMPQQLDLWFEIPPVQQSVSHVEPSVAAPGAPASSTSIEVIANSAVVINFQSAVTRREESIRTVLYRQILDSVRHIG